jgi:hypothetical protein
LGTLNNVTAQMIADAAKLATQGKSLLAFDTCDG